MPSDHRDTPVVIIGRTNVGKSSLFNALINQRRAITSSVRGVTRDNISVLCNWGRHRLMLVDTGGQGEHSTMAQLVTAQAQKMVLKAAVVLLVVESRGLHATDTQIISHLRLIAKPVIAVINKIDAHSPLDTSADLYQLGLETIVEVSATHNKNISHLKRIVKEQLVKEKLAKEQFATNGASGTGATGTGASGTGATGTGAAGTPSQSSTFSIALIGKPNCGKSTLANTIVGHTISVVSEYPGTTRDTVQGSFALSSTSPASSPQVNTTTNTTVDLFDTAGLRRPPKVKDAVEYYATRRAMQSILAADICLLLVDIWEGMTSQDKRISRYAIDKGKGLIIACNKTDTIDTDQQAQKMHQIRRATRYCAYLPVVTISARTGYGIPRLCSTLEVVWNELTHQAPTARLNKVAGDALAKIGHRVSGRYLTQTGTNPVEFVMYARHKPPPHILRYLENSIQTQLGFKHIPIKIVFRPPASS